MRMFPADPRERRLTLRLVLAAILLVFSGCGGSDPCDQCYDDDYYYEHPYYCQECLQDKGNESSMIAVRQTSD